MTASARNPIHTMASVFRVMAVTLILAVSASAVAAPPPNDDCSTPDFIGGTGVFLFDTTEATTGVEGQNNQLCDTNGTGVTGIENDVWYCWTATCSGIVRIRTCGLTQVDTKIAIYRQCGCPTFDALCCADDECGEQTELVCDVLCGEQYMIQLGQKPNGLPGGPGEFEIICEGNPCPPSIPCCIDFNDGTTNGFGPCPTAPNVAVSVNQPGPSGQPGDFYLETRDLSGGSRACGTPCINDWTHIADSGCGALCWDYIVIEDSCVPGIPECDANGGWIPITPRMIIQSGTLRAMFVANFTVTDPVGPNPGWHTVCAPIAFTDASGNMPSNEFGAWQMLDGAPNTQWNTLLSNVTDIVLPVEFTSNPAEISGWDNICLRDDVCPCLEITNEEILCEVDPVTGPTGNYIYTFDLTNLSGVTVQYILLPDPNVQPNIITLPTPLPDGQTTTVTMTLNGLTPQTEYCFDMVLADEQVQECCRFVICVTPPECDCMQFQNVQIECVPGGNGPFTLTFDMTNLTPVVIAHMFFFPPLGSGVTITPDYLPVANLNPYQTATFGPVTIENATPGEELCIRISIHIENLVECCSVELCFIVPDCQTPFDPCDLNQNGVVDVADLLILLAAWGECSATPCIGDLDSSGVVDVADLLLLLSNWD